MKAFSITDIGEGRNTNQDYVFCHEKPIGNLPNLFIVADGMGGHRAGDYASKFCVEFFKQKIKESTLSLPIHIIENALEETNEMLIKKSQEQSDLKGMGTTFVVSTIFDELMYVANVGDSRLYIIEEEMKQITEDHSLVEVMVKTGELDPDEAKDHPNKNVITRALGANQSIKADIFEVILSGDETVLMCSDGLTNMVEDADIKKIVDEFPDDLEKAGLALVNSANKNGGKDNISIIIIKV